MVLNKIEPCERLALTSLAVGLCAVAVVDWWRDIVMGFWPSIMVCVGVAVVFHCVGLMMEAQRTNFGEMPKRR
jgi:hypothetical protein